MTYVELSSRSRQKTFVLQYCLTHHRMMSLAANATSPGATTARTNRREQLIATLEALIYNDDVDLDLFQPGVPWPEARNIITQQPHTQVRAPTPEERGNIHSDYKHGPSLDSAMGGVEEYSHLYPDTFQNFHTQSDSGTDKTRSWFPHMPEIGFEGSVNMTPSYIAPPLPTPPPAHCHGHHTSSYGLENSTYGQLNVQDPGGYNNNYDFSKPLNTPPARQPADVAYPSISKASNLPLLDFMSWDMFMDYGSGVSPRSTDMNDMNNNDSTHSASEFDDDRKASVSSRVVRSAQPVQSPSDTTPSASKRPRRHKTRRDSKCASPSPPPCSRPIQATEKGCQPKGHRAHSAIEKRYRAGLNEKFEALRSCVESRKMAKQESLGQALRPESKGGENGGATIVVPDRKKGPGANSDAASRMNKAEVLREAVECIEQLEDENGLLLEQLKILVQRLRATRMALQPTTPMSSASSLS
ncbi:hypothetical protein N0V93_007826 [Gnomoniopsis smithogilvyi]|uniref:BHLH domain-containing protein n=1 Tax=Gnomoniopsis smithogilvyi TaxID=1191159 RepID=A0A9W8YP52_9PEZI|nr:hypothetical protein N0V93_007826 [Gnomoniopsis smithogilvyi]